VSGPLSALFQWPWYSLVLTGIAGFSFAILVFSYLRRPLERLRGNQAINPENQITALYEQSDFQNEAISVSEIVKKTDRPFTIHHKTFVHCVISGPGLIYMPRTVNEISSDCTFADRDYLIRNIPAKTPLVGVIDVRYCKFTACRFEGVGIVQPEDG